MTVYHNISDCRSQGSYFLYSIYLTRSAQNASTVHYRLFLVGFCLSFCFCLFPPIPYVHDVPVLNIVREFGLDKIPLFQTWSQPPLNTVLTHTRLLALVCSSLSITVTYHRCPMKNKFLQNTFFFQEHILRELLESVSS